LSIAALVQVKMSSNFNCSYISSHLEWSVGLSETMLKRTHPGTIPARFGLLWFSGFRGKDLNVIFYQNMPNLYIGIYRLKEMPCELLPSLFVYRPSVNISHFNLLLRNHWANSNQTLVEWSLDGPLPKMCPVILTSINRLKEKFHRKTHNIAAVKI
jgi:hypothetical protein